MISNKAKHLVETVFEKSGLGKWFNKETITEPAQPTQFVVEGTGNVVNMSFDEIKVDRLSPFDIVINKHGKMFNVDSVEINENAVNIIFIDNNNNEIAETFLPETVMGFVDNVYTTSYNEFGDKIEIYEDSKKKVKLNKIMSGDVKKYKVYVKNDKGNVVKVNFGDPNMEIKRDNPARRKSFRARHHCENPGPRWKARYWACRTWSTKSVSSMLKEETNVLHYENNDNIINHEIVEHTINSIQNLKYDPNLWGHLNESK